MRAKVLARAAPRSVITGSANIRKRSGVGGGGGPPRARLARAPTVAQSAGELALDPPARGIPRDAGAICVAQLAPGNVGAERVSEEVLHAVLLGALAALVVAPQLVRLLDDGLRQR